jgi:hypothetical protein
MLAVLERPATMIESRVFDGFIRAGNRQLAKELRLSRINADDPFFVCTIPEVDHFAYHRYVRRYVKQPGTPDEPFWAVAAKSLGDASSAP